VRTSAHIKELRIPINSRIAPKTGRIMGTLHKRDHAPPVPLKDAKLTGESAERIEVAGSDKSVVEMQPKGTR
jgi:hypothetical protein